MNELTVLGKLAITYDLTGFPVIENYELVYDTLSSMLDGADKLIITADESSVDSAKSLKSKMTAYQKAIDDMFEVEIGKLKELESKKRDLKRLFERVKAYLTSEVDRAKVEWVKEAVQAYGRLATEDVTVEMIPKESYSRKQTKKAVMEAVQAEIEKIEEAYKLKEQDKEMLKAYCSAKNQPHERYMDWLEYKPLSEVMAKVDAAAEQQAVMERTVEVAEPVEVIEPVTAGSTDDSKVWNLNLKMTRQQRLALKMFLSQNGIEIVGKPYVA